MKGLLLASLDRRSEGLELAKQGVRFDLTSFIAWHALGILHRMSKNYSESIKCYLQALKIEGGNNVNLTRESAYLYVQLREWNKVVETRGTLVRIQPHLRMNWIGLILGLHLGGDCAEALRVIDQFELIHRVSASMSLQSRRKKY
jgi:tetratricopeptide (TPR) repeat protein